jgi:hypothetical protein
MPDMKNIRDASEYVRELIESHTSEEGIDDESLKKRYAVVVMAVTGCDESDAKQTAEYMYRLRENLKARQAQTSKVKDS